MEAKDLYEEGRSRMAAGAVDEAIALFRRSAALDPHFKTLELLGECHCRLEQWKEAVAPLAAATTLNRQSRAPALLAEVFEQLGDRDRAIELAHLALSRDGHTKRAKVLLQRLGDSAQT